MGGLDRQTELARVKDRGCEELPPIGLDRFEIDVRCRGDASSVLDLIRDVLQVVIEQDPEQWPSSDEWRRLLPTWFVGACAGERTKEEAERWLRWWRSLPKDEQEAASRNERWSIDEFIHWFQRSEREWWWWGADVVSGERIRVCLAVEEPTPSHEALDWLLRVSGAVEVIDENVRDINSGVD